MTAIQNRLKKLEKQVIDDSTVCACNGSQPLYKYTYADEGILRNPSEADAEICKLCGREVNKKVIVIDYVKDWKPGLNDR